MSASIERIPIYQVSDTRQCDTEVGVEGVMITVDEHSGTLFEFLRAARRGDHALALQTDHACRSFQSQALKSDGPSRAGDCIPEGARLQLDPKLDLDKLGLSRGEIAVAKAMQRYGGLIMDACPVCR